MSSNIQHCPLVHVPGFHKDMIKKCSMHCINLGYGLLVNGNTMLELVERGGMYGEGPLNDRLHALWCDFKRWLRENNIRSSQPRFTVAKLGMQSLSNSPELDTKAYNSRVITGYLAEAASAELLRDESHHALLRAAAVWGLAALYDRVERAPRIMSREEADAAAEAGMVSLQAYNALAVESVAAMRCRWTCKPKLHKVHHLIRDMQKTRQALSSRHVRCWTCGVHCSDVCWMISDLCCIVHSLNAETVHLSGLNFRFFHGFVDEDFMGKIVRLAQRCPIQLHTHLGDACVSSLVHRLRVHRLRVQVYIHMDVCCVMPGRIARARQLARSAGTCCCWRSSGTGERL
jgi:hypothetical protein